MSGHSKWNNIKRAKGKSDAQKGKIFTKLGRELAVIVKTGGADPNTNPKLKDAITKAKQNNMPSDTIMRSIKKASGELNSINYEDIIYEGYGVSGSAVIVKSLTDNKNRTAGDLRHIFDKYGGSLGLANSVSYMFDNRGIIIIEKTPSMNVDDVMMTALDGGALDVIEESDIIQILTEPGKFASVKDFMEKNKYIIASSSIEMIPQIKIELGEDKATTFRNMIEKMEDLDDVQEVFHNVDLPEIETED